MIEDFFNDAFKSIGMMVVVAIVLYLLFKKSIKNEAKRQDLNDLAQYNDKCKKLIAKIDFSKYDYAFESRVKKEIATILSDPKEVEEAVRNREKSRQLHKQINEETRKRFIQYRVFSYDYQSDIYELFSIKKAYHKDELIGFIKDKYSKDETESEQLFSLWKSNHLIQERDKQFHVIGLIYEDKAHVITDEDLSFDEWKNYS